MISFVVPAHNEERLLPRTLVALHTVGRRLKDDYELIVVDDASSDRTTEVAEEHGARVVRVTHRQIATTRNSGAREARGRLLVFVDADTIVPEEALNAALQAVRDGAVGGGARITLDGAIPLYGKILVPIILKLLRVLRLAPGCFIFCTRESFDSIGGFDEDLYAGEEIELSRALGEKGRFVLLDEAVTTSGRKFRVHSAWQILGTMFQLAFQGSNAIKSRDALALWYGERRNERDGGH